MAWTTPKTWVSEPLISVDLNTHVRDNQNYLKSRIDTTAKQYIRTSGNYITTSTSLVDIDPVDLVLMITTIGGDVRVTFVGHATGAGGDRTLSVGVDIDNIKYTILSETETGSANLSFSYIFTGLSAGPHIFKMLWSTNADTATMYAGQLLFDVREEIGLVA